MGNSGAGGDLELLQMSQQLNKSGNDKNTNIVRGAMGLGYDKSLSQAELEANQQIQKLKNQIKRSGGGNDTDTQKKGALTDQNTEISKFGIQKKDKQNQDNKSSMIEGKKEKKRLKKERQKTKKQDEKNKQSSAEQKVQGDLLKAKEDTNTDKLEKSKVYMRIKNFDKMKNEELQKKAEEEGGQFKKFRTKTRSKQKNKRRDNRPLDVKMAKLASKGITLNQ